VSNMLMIDAGQYLREDCIPHGYDESLVDLVI